MRKSRLYHGIAGLAAVGLLACGGSPTGAGSGNGDPNGNSTAKVQALPSLQFSPATITIAPGQSLTWVFGSVGHTVTFDSVNGHPDDIGDPAHPRANTSVARTFAQAGTYTYHCSIHPSMTGTVIVTAAAGGTGATSTPDTGGTPPDTSYTKSAGDTTYNSNPYGGR